MTVVEPRTGDGPPVSGEDLELAELVLRRLRQVHGGCGPEHCPQRRLWHEDVAEIVALVRDLS